MLPGAALPKAFLIRSVCGNQAPLGMVPEACWA